MYCPDQSFRRCVPKKEHKSIWSFCHDQACGRDFGARKTAESNLIFIGPLSLKTYASFAIAALAVNMWAESQKET